MSEKDAITTRLRATEIYYDALIRGATVRIETQGVTRGVPQRMEEEMSGALGDDPTELLAYIFRRGYKLEERDRLYSRMGLLRLRVARLHQGRLTTLLLASRLPSVEPATETDQSAVPARNRFMRLG